MEGRAKTFFDFECEQSREVIDELTIKEGLVVFVLWFIKTFQTEVWSSFAGIVSGTLEMELN